MDIDATFMPVAVELIDSVFPTAIIYKRDEGSSYDPATGDVTPNVVDYAIKAGVLSRGRVEAGGTAESYELRLWIQHSASGLPHLPTTADQVVYDGTTWRVSTIDPTYSSKGLIASKIHCSNQ
jgi:hypothetical protein